MTTESKLATALRDYCARMESFQPQGELGAMHGAGMAFAYKDTAAIIRKLLAAHQAQDGDAKDAARYRLLRRITHSLTGKGPRAVMNIYREDGTFMVPGRDDVSAVTLDQAVDELLAAPPPQQDGDAKDVTLKWALDAGGVLADWCNKSGDALHAMMAAYERRVRSLCTPEEIEKEPWRCAEFIGAESVLREKPTWGYVISQASAPPPQQQEAQS